MILFYRFAADVVVVVHFAYVAFVILGLAAIVVGAAANWHWTRNAIFRSVHLLAILIVVVESLCGVTCPLTTWEHTLRSQAGDASYEGDFVATFVHETLFIEAEPWVFTLCYSLFGLLVLLSFWFSPPRFRRSRLAEESSDENQSDR